jgi:hypothetical protein
MVIVESIFGALSFSKDTVLLLMAVIPARSEEVTCFTFGYITAMRPPH